MTNYFSGFNPTSFEQFVRVLAIQVFGPGVTVFGNGPDGGREATFNGKVNYPFPQTEHWDGYGVIQAKFKEKIETTKADQGWAIDQLKQELKTFAVSAKRNPKPQYYVFVTNVDLTSASSGGKDEANEIIKRYSEQLPLKNHAIWDGNQVKAYIDRYEDIRKRFLAYLTTGDLIAELIKVSDLDKSDSASIINDFLNREIIADEYARLDQAGNRSDSELSLSKLFFDIPASEIPNSEPPVESIDDMGRLPTGVLNELLTIGSQKRDPETIFDLKNNGHERLAKNRFILFGGPGSGKSTIVQFLAQIHRAALLERKQKNLPPDILKKVEEIHNQSDRQGLVWPSTPRIPIRIDLNHFGKALSRADGSGVSNLEEYIVKKIRGHWELNLNSFNRLLPNFPWLLILDGLDEVPSTSNRTEVMNATLRFIALAFNANADMFVVATSRRQGYQNEFQDMNTETRYVLPLSKERSLRYAEQYIEAKFAKTDPAKRETVLSKIKNETRNIATRDLLSSPLQVTFLVTVVSAGGDLSTNRWKLYNDYYDTIYKREQQKSVPPYDTILSAYKHIIDRLHQELGFWLQYRGEVSSADGVSVVTGVLKNWIREYLEDDGFEGDDKDQLIEKITGVTDHRLVFLTNRNGEEWSFEVRSLQEYMAAECLLSRSDSVVVEERLRSISLKSYWRNVYLFAAGKAFNQVDTLDLRDKIFRICYVGANTESEISTYSRLSEELALDLLESGAIKTNPRYQKEFISFLAGILKSPTSRGCDPVFFDVFGSNIHRRIARVVDKQSSEMLVSILNSILEKDTVSSVSMVSWLVLICLVDQGYSSAIKSAELNWPKSSSMQSDILLFADSFDHTSWIFKKLLDFVSCAEPREIRKLSYRSMFSRLNGAYPVLTNLMERIGRDEKPKVRFLDEFGMYIQFIPLSFERSRAIVDSLKSFHRVDGHLNVYLCAETFLTCPNKDTLAEVLRFAAEIDVFAQSYILPWVIADCVAFANNKDELLRFADMASKGELGDYEDWIAAESRWESKGLVIDDLTYVANHRLPFDLFISRVGYPRLHSLLIRESDRNKASSFVDLLVDNLPQILNPRTRHDVLRWVVFFGTPLQEADFTEVIMPAFLKEVVIDGQLSLNRRWQIGDAGLVDNKAEWLDFLDWSGTRGIFCFRNISVNWRECLKNEFMSNPTRSGLLNHLFNSMGDDESDVWKFVAECTVLKIEAHDSSLGFLLLLIRLYNSRDSSSHADDVYAEIRSNFHLIKPPSHRRLFFVFTACLIGIASDRASLLVRLYEAISISDANAGFHYLSRMRELLANTPSSLQDRAELSRLNLPSSPSWATEKN
jgi:hypothetical protein